VLEFRNTENLANFALVIAVTCLLAMTLGLCFLASPSADDFCTASVRLHELPGAVVNAYKLWTGRWAEQSIDIAMFPGNGLAPLYPAVLIALIAAYFASVYCFVSNFLHTAASRVGRIQISVAFTALFIAGMASLGEGVFWASGAVSSVLPAFGAICLLGLLMSHIERPTRGVQYAGVAALSILVTGLHELFALILCILLGMGALATVSTRHTRSRLWIAAFISALLGSAIVFLAPGNRIREAMVFAGVPQSSWPQILYRGTHTFGDRVVMGWVPDVRLLAATLLFVWHPAIRHFYPTWVRQFRSRARLFVLSGFFLTMTAPFVLPGLIVSKVFFPLPGRTFDGLYAIFLFGWFSTVFVFTRPARDPTQDEVVPRIRYRLACIVFALSLLWNFNSLTMYRDLRSKATPWRSAIAARVGALHAARAENRLDLVVASLAPVTPGSFFYQDAEADPKYFCNVCIARYFGLNTIVATATMTAPEMATTGLTTGIPFFAGSVNGGGGRLSLRFPNGNIFGYYAFLSGGWVYHVDLGYEYVAPGNGPEVYLWDLASRRWWYTNRSAFPYLYDFTLNAWIYYFPDTHSAGHYTTNPRYFVNMKTGRILTM
jgi:hypothetical protein